MRWRRPIGCLKLQVIFRKRAADYRALLRKVTCKDKASFGSLPPCRRSCNQNVQGEHITWQKYNMENNFVWEEHTDEQRPQLMQIVQQTNNARATLHARGTQMWGEQRIWEEQLLQRVQIVLQGKMCEGNTLCDGNTVCEPCEGKTIRHTWFPSHVVFPLHILRETLYVKHYEGTIARETLYGKHCTWEQP